MSIVPRKGTAGVSWSHQKEETLSFNQKEALASIKCGLGGYVAEKIKYSYSSGGVEQDFKTIMGIAYSMVYRWGMGESGYLGNFSALFLTNRSTEPMISEEAKAKLDADVQKIIKQCKDEVEQVLIENRALLDKFAAELLEKEELDYDQMEEIFKAFGKTRAQA